MKQLGLKKSDKVLIAGLCLLSVAVLLLLFVFRNPGGTAVLTVNGEETGEFPLSEPREVEISHGNHNNLLVIRDGKAYITEANCPDKVCVNRGGIQYQGETIVCVPNGVVVTIREGEKKDTDAVAQ